MADALQLVVVTPEGEALDVSCREAVIPGLNGEIGFAPGHIPLITAVRPGVLTVIHEHDRAYFAVCSGFAEINEGRVRILVDACEPAAEIDAERAKRALQASQEALSQLGPEQSGYNEAVERQARATARLNARARIS